MLGFCDLSIQLEHCVQLCYLQCTEKRKCQMMADKINEYSEHIVIKVIKMIKEINDSCRN